MVRYRTKFYYEWDVETVDLDGDIIDHNHGDTLAELKSWFEFPTEEGQHNRIVLVKDVSDDVVFDDGEVLGDVQDRTWAYPENSEENGWQMPAEFESGGAVPKRFIAEFARNREWTGSGSTA